MINGGERRALLTEEYQRPAGSVEGALQRKVTVQPSERSVQARGHQWVLNLRGGNFAEEQDICMSSSASTQMSY